MIADEELIVTENGETVASAVDVRKSAVDTLRGLLKNAPQDTSVDAIRAERLSDYEDNA